jgi:hypothetical protein
MPEKGIRWETGAAPATVSVDERANHCTGCFFWRRYGKGFIRMKHKPGDLPILEVSILRGAGTGNGGTDDHGCCFSAVFAVHPPEMNGFFAFKKGRRKRDIYSTGIKRNDFAAH